MTISEEKKDDMNVTRLSSANLKRLSKAGVEIPKYDRSQLQEGILQVGVGNFHRGHLATYLDDLMDKGEAKEWGLVGAGLHSKRRRDTIEPQDWLQTIVEQDADGAKPRIVGNMVDFLPVEPDEHNAIYEKMLEPNIKIVSLLVTEGGYILNSENKLDTENPDIKHDMNNHDEPKTIWGVLVKALKARKQKGLPPFTIMSCDNVPSNGDVTKSIVVGLAKYTDSDTAKWIEQKATFPNSMVDRITPSTSDEHYKLLWENYGLEDASPVFCEPFRQWVMEDKFCNGRPPLEKVGVEFVSDVTPFEIMKLRILNGGHGSLSYPAGLLGVEYVHDAMNHPSIWPFLDCIERNEMIPTVPPVPGTDLGKYWETVAKRFSNPTIKDTINRNCNDGSSRQPKFIVPVAQEALKNGTPFEGLALVSAMWCRYCQGKREDGSKIKPNDPNWDDLQERALKAKDDPSVWLQMEDVYGEVGKNKKFVDAFSKALKSIEKDGVEGAMKKYVESKK